MPDRLFVSQEQLEQWIERGEGRFEDMRLTLLKENKSYPLRNGVHFRGLIDGADSAGLLGQVKTVDEVVALGGEYFQGTVILGEVAYECQDGYVGPDEPAQAASPPPATAVAAAEPALAESNSVGAKPAEVEQAASSSGEEADRLADFWLKNLS